MSTIDARQKFQNLAWLTISTNIPIDCQIDRITHPLERYSQTVTIDKICEDREIKQTKDGFSLSNGMPVLALTLDIVLITTTLESSS